MTIKQLEYFMGVARHLNYSTAAKELFISQPSLSRSITALENELGVRLFSRDKHNVSLTPAGAVLSAAIPRLGVSLSKVMAEVQQTAEGQLGRFRLGILDGLLLPDDLLRGLRYFRQELPYVDIHPVCLTMEELITAVRNGSVDMIFSYDTETARDAALHQQLLGGDCFCAAVRKDLPAAQADAVELKDLMQERLFMACTDASFEIHRWKEICTRQGFMPNFITVLNNSTLCLCIEQGYGIALLPESHRLFLNPIIKKLPLKTPVSLHYVVKWSDTNPNPCIGIFLDAINGRLQ